MTGWLLNLSYLLLLVAASPLLAWRMLRQGKYRTGWREKFLGQLPISPEHESVVWFHAVSVGEVLQLRTLVGELESRTGSTAILITTTTQTGRAVAQQTFPNCRIAYCPLDFTWAVRTALRRVRPRMVGLVELELWPNLIRETADAGIPLMLINGRMSHRSYRGYRRIRPLIRSLLRRFEAIAVQTDEYASRLIDLGAPQNRLEVTGSMKFDGVQIETTERGTAELRSAFAIAKGQQVLVAGSTHAPEEELLLATWQALRAEFPKLRLVLVPRHQERFDEVAGLIAAAGYQVVRRSCGAAPREIGPESVCLLDTLGELSACWPLADVAFVGGSLTRRGGQNMIEPAAQGAAVVVGPNTWNFRDVVEGLQSVHGLRVVDAADQLADCLRNLLLDRTAMAQQTVRARQFVEAQQGATLRTVEIMGRFLPYAGRSRAA